VKYCNFRVNLSSLSHNLLVSTKQGKTIADQGRQRKGKGKVTERKDKDEVKT